MGLQEVRGGYKGVTGDDKGIQGMTRNYAGLQGMTRGYRE